MRARVSIDLVGVAVQLGGAGTLGAGGQVDRHADADVDIGPAEAPPRFERLLLAPGGHRDDGGARAVGQIDHAVAALLEAAGPTPRPLEAPPASAPPVRSTSSAWFIASRSASAAAPHR